MEQSQQFWKTLLGGNHLVPLVNSPYSVFLDANCLSGAYVSDLASEFPSARVIGIGREHALPSNTPPNSMFVVVENIAAGTSLASNSCHFVQSRDVSSFMKVENWKAYLHELYRILDAGGWIQVLEVSVWRQYPDDEGGGYQAWSQRLFPSLAAIKGVGLSNLDYWLLQWAREIGFVDICPVRVQIPVGDWGNTQLPPNLVEAGKLLRQNLLSVVDANRALLSSIVMDRRESEILVACARGELYDDSFTAMHNTFGFVARKPSRS